MEIIAREKTAGGQNLYQLSCVKNDKESYHRYGLCQHIIKAAAEKRLTGFGTCVPKFKDRSCQALKMMLEEAKAKRALYYELPRVAAEPQIEQATTKVNKDSDSYRRGWAMAGGDPLPKRTTVTKSSPPKQKEVVFDPAQMLRNEAIKIQQQTNQDL